MDGSQEARRMKDIPLVGAVSAKALAACGRSYIEQGIYLGVGVIRMQFPRNTW
jgi:hypothetical protein